jgi:hypothetical protein
MREAQSVHTYIVKQTAGVKLPRIPVQVEPGVTRVAPGAMVRSFCHADQQVHAAGALTPHLS